MTYHRCKRCGYRTSSVIAIQGHMRTHIEQPTIDPPIAITIISKLNGVTVATTKLFVEDGQTITIDLPVELEITARKPSLT